MDDHHGTMAEAERLGLAVRRAVVDGCGAPRWLVALADRAGREVGAGAGATLGEALAAALAAAAMNGGAGGASA